jgi:hypothetical protein
LLLAVIAAAIVHRLKPEWLAVSLRDAASSLDTKLRPERLSRLSTAAIELFEPIVVTLTRRGRPPRDATRDQRDVDLRLTRALLETASSILRLLGVRGRDARELVIGAWLRLSKENALTQERFAAALGLSPRTFRSWLKRRDARPRPARPEKEPPPRRRSRPPRRLRFDFDLTVPDLQEAADTTDLKAFDVPLKLIAAQDIGGRDTDLFDSVIVDDHESADLVIKVFKDALQDQPGAQAITDQGSPYMAEATREALAGLEAEHAPQKEAHPQGKATIERAFATVKGIARPILSLTDRLATCFPALRNVELAKAMSTLVLITILRAYQAGARAARRADEARALIVDEEVLARVAQEARERARADDRSARLLLGHIFDAYDLPGSRPDFVNTLRGYPHEVLQAAERAFRRQVHRDDIKDRRSYFAAIVRHCNEEHRRRRTMQQQHDELSARLARAEASREADDARRRDEPVAALRQGLDGLALQWQPKAQALTAGGAGVARAIVRIAVQRLADLYGPTAAHDAVAGVRHAFARANKDKLGPAAIRAIDDVLADLLSNLDQATPGEASSPRRELQLLELMSPA